MAIYLGLNFQTELKSLFFGPFAAFICLVIFRYCRQHVEAKVEEEEVGVEEEEEEEEQQQQALVVLEQPVKKGA